jgi:hypothetical protein
MHSTDKAVQFLRDIDRTDLAALIRFSTFRVVEEPVWDDINVAVVELSSPALFDEALRGLSDWEHKRIVEAIIKSADAAVLRGHTPERLAFKVSDAPPLQASDALIAEVFIHANEMIAVAADKKVPIRDVNDYYRARHKRIAAQLAELGVDDPNPHTDLWHFYKKWSAELPSWKERRRYVRDLYEPLIQRLTHADTPLVPIREPTGWDRVDRTLAKAHDSIRSARHEEDFQTIGLLCREILISLGQAVFDPTAHSTDDGVVPSNTDGGRMIEAFLRTAASGGSNENVRKHARAALSLAVELQHKRTADFRGAALCLEATSSITNIVAILSGRRDTAIDSPSSEPVA